MTEQRYDLVFSDYNMPEMNGEQFLKYVRMQSWQSSVPVLLISSEQDAERLAAIKALGISGICNKPFEPSTLKALIEAALNDAAK
jgi:two-component system chemotaxis response regulator CheY